MAWTTPRTWVAGETVTAALFNSHIRDNFNAIGAAWTAYTPTITGVTTSTLTARNLQRGKTTEVRCVFTLTGAPSALVTVSLPVAASTAFGTGAIYLNIGTVTGLRQGVGYRFASVYLASATTVAFVNDNTVTGWAAGVPVAWANTDIWSFVCSYEAA